MKICFPVKENQGLESTVFGHFGSAPMFLVVDSQTGEVTEVRNNDLPHAHGSCSPMKALGGQRLDAIVVGGIGGGALKGLTRSGLKVYRSLGDTIADNLACLAHVQLPELTQDQVCGGHGHSCGHG